VISILIPTLNRSDFLLRALYYYSRVGFDGYICIGDSSNAQHSERIKRAIQALKGELEIIYRYLPNPPYTNDALCMKELVESTPTPYAVYSGDDDFLIPNGLKQCIAFLDDHTEYSAVHGVRIAVVLESSGAFGKITRAYHRPQPVLEYEKVYQRWAGWMRHGTSTQYSVHRTDTWRRMYRDAVALLLRDLGSEVYPCSLSAILGKVKGLDCLTAVWQDNPGRFFEADYYSLMIHPEWSRTIQAIRCDIAEAIAQKDDLAMKDAYEMVDKELFPYILVRLQSHYNHVQYNAGHTKTNIKSVLNRVLSYIPGFMSLVQSHRGKVSGTIPLNSPLEKISLPSLLKPSSCYYTDFMPIYQLIRTGREIRLE